MYYAAWIYVKVNVLVSIYIKLIFFDEWLGIAYNQETFFSFFLSNISIDFFLF